MHKNNWFVKKSVMKKGELKVSMNQNFNNLNADVL